MAPKRRPAAAAAASTAAGITRAATQRASKLAKEHGATAQQEADIREAYSLFCIADPHRQRQHEDADGSNEEDRGDKRRTNKKRKATSGAGPATGSSGTKKGGDDLDGTVIRTGDVRRCLVALNAAPADRSEAAEILDTLDPEKVGVVAFEHFFAIAAIKVQARFRDGDGGGDEDEDGYDDGIEDDDDDENDSNNDDHDKIRRRAKGKARAGALRGGGGVRGRRAGGSTSTEAELRAAFALFTKGEGDMITLAHLRRVARELREEVDDKMLKDMIREANGGGAGGGGGSTSRPGVALEEFGDVMRRAGVFG